MPEHALDALERLDESGPLHSHVLYLQGEALRTLARYEEALRPLGDAADLAPSNIHIRLAQGWCYKRLGRLADAVDVLEDALEAADDEAILHYNLACYLSLSGEKHRALHHLSTAFDLEATYRDLVEEEPDFDPLRSDPDFQELTSIIV